MSLLSRVITCLVFATPMSINAQEVSTLTDPPFVASGDLAVDANGDIFVANFGDFLNNANGTQVYRVSPEGAVSLFADGLQGAAGNTFDDEGNLYQASIAGNTVSRITPDGTVTTIADAGDGINNPVGLTFDGRGNLFVANCGNNSIRKITPEGVSSAFSSGGRLSCPNGLTADSRNNIYAANFSNGEVLRILPTGQMGLFATTPGSITKPGGGNGHIIFGNDRLYVVSNATQRVYEIDVDTGDLTVLAGFGSKGREDGPLLEARFSLPNGIDLSPDGTLLYINDSENTGLNNNIAPNVVRVVELPSDEPPFAINAGLNDAWFNQATIGQGFFIIVFPSLEKMFLAWFTFDTERPDDSIEAILGEPGHRWLTAFGPYEGGTATLNVEITSGGMFDNAAPMPGQVPGGTITVEFSDCGSGVVTYDLTEPDIMGAVSIERAAADNVDLCEALQAD